MKPRCVMLAGLLAAALPAWAQEDGLSLSASWRIQRDDNLFRLPDGVDPRQALGSPSAAETVHLRSLGLAYARDFSLQRLEVDVGLIDYDYERYRQLDLLARNYDLRWRWAFTPQVTGTLRTSRDESVNSFDDASALTRGNRRLARFNQADARWRLDGAWSLLAEAQQSRNDNEQPLVGEDSSRLRSAAVGVLRETPKGSQLSLRWREGSGETLDAVGRTPDALRDDDFRQREWLLDARWPVSAQLALDASLIGRERTHRRLPRRDFDALDHRLSIDWLSSAKTRLRLSNSRDTGGYQTNNANVVRTDRWSLGGSWFISSKLSLQADWSVSDRSYREPPAGAAPDLREDRTTDRLLSLRWAFTRQAALDLAWQHSRRDSNDARARYRSALWRLGVSARF